LIIGFLLFYSGSLYGSCWKANERAELEFAEFDDVVVLSFKDAVDCTPIDGAVVEVFGETFNTDGKGLVEIPAEYTENIQDRKIDIYVTKNGYIPFNSYLNVIFDSVWNKMNLMSKKLKADEVRFVLQWAKEPADLDLHLKSNDFHISYRNMKNASFKATLDRDAVKGYGPETITLKRIEEGKTYKVFVHHYAGNMTIDQRAQVHVYFDNKLDKVLSLPKTNKKYVHILNLEQGTINYVNEPVAKPF